MNIYAGAPEHMGEIVQEAATKSLENEIRDAIDKLCSDGYGIDSAEETHKYQAVIMILGSLIGEEEVERT